MTTQTLVTVQTKIHTLTTPQTQILLRDHTRVNILTAGIQGPTGQGVPTGGSAGQILVKTSGEDYETAWKTSLRSISIPIYNPNDHYAVLPKPALFYVDPDQYPNGISIKEARLSSYAAVTYSMGVIDMSTPNDASPTTITTLSLSASRETSNTLSTTVAAGRYIGLNIPSTATTYVNTQIWFEAL